MLTLQACHRSLGHHHHLHPDIIFLTETWLNPESAPDIVSATPDGYKIAHRDSITKQGGGIAIIHKENISCTTTTDNATQAMEHLNFKLQTDGKTNIRGTLAYRPPGPRPSFCNTIPNLIGPLTIVS